LNLTCIVGSYSIVCICYTHDFHEWWNIFNMPNNL
jgi:hypothetical protein